MEQILALDYQLLFFVNRRLTHPWNDVIMSLWSKEWPWILVFLVFAFLAWRKRSAIQAVQLAWIGITIGLTDLFGYHVLKWGIGRLRPCKTEEFVRAIEGCAGMVGFPSNHAANAAVFAGLWFLFHGPRQGALALGCCLTIGFSRVYLGVHYPSDVIAGFIYGGLVAFMSFYLLKRIPRLQFAAPDFKKDRRESVDENLQVKRTLT